MTPFSAHTGTRGDNNDRGGSVDFSHDTPPPPPRLTGASSPLYLVGGASVINERRFTVSRVYIYIYNIIMSNTRRQSSYMRAPDNVNNAHGVYIFLLYTKNIYECDVR